ncbi:putative rab3 GTPase-activating protein non-catalytic subunit [Cocos nucifera]|uniref:Putative rab3 GTPase-activating protein non-catalytic subunit n=1 Tax=Cocos nucifera TaxID=13894 RepID=A0A8K0IUE0_COCNU|nr:putative rab3 GTPase-activating protein non-catalytic subunit [Cocos nucifera]
MARRSHLTHVGCIACDELEELGAGEREGWLDDPSLLAALHPDALALAHSSRSLVLVLGWDRDPDPSSPRQPLKIRPSLATDDGHISAIEWLPFGDLLALALGTSAGILIVYSLTGDLIHKQIIHPGRVLRLRFRETKVDSSQDSVSSMELCVVLPAAFIAGQSSQRHYCAVTIGEDAVISAYRLSEDRSRSLVGAILSKVVPATFSTLASFSKMIWRSEQTSPKKPNIKPQPFAKGQNLVPVRVTFFFFPRPLLYMNC